MKNLIRFSYRYSHPTKTYLKSKRKLIITGYEYLSPIQIKELIKIINYKASYNYEKKSIPKRKKSKQSI